MTKRKYESPEITVHSLDKEICLVMASIPDDPEDGSDPFGAMSGSGPEKINKSVIFGESENPFGGNRPKY